MHGNGAMTDFVRPTVIFWLLLTVIAIQQISTAIFDPSVSLGEAIAIALTILIAAVSGGLMLGKWCRSIWPFKMEFSDQPYDIPRQAERFLRTRLESYTDRRKITLKLQTRRATDISDIDVRFITKLMFFFGPAQDVNRDIVRITGVTLPDWEKEADVERDYTGPNTVQTRQAGLGGMQAYVRKRKRWVIGDPLWIELEIVVNKPWRGYLSFRSQTDRRPTTRRPVKFRERR